MANQNVHLWGNVQPMQGVASAAILPGSLIEIITAAGATQGQLRHHATAAARTSILVANIAGYFGKGLSDAYAAGEGVEYFAPAPGNLFKMRLAASQTIVRGQLLESAGDGTLRAQAAAGIGLFEAEEAVTTTGAGGFIQARVVNF